MQYEGEYRHWPWLVLSVQNSKGQSQLLSSHTFQSFFDQWQNSVDDDIYPGGGGVDTVCLIQFMTSNDAFKKKRIKWDLVLSGQFRIEAIELEKIILTEISRCFHSDQQGLNVGSSESAEDCRQILACL